MLKIESMTQRINNLNEKLAESEKKAVEEDQNVNAFRSLNMSL